VLLWLVVLEIYLVEEEMITIIRKRRNPKRVLEIEDHQLLLDLQLLHQEEEVAAVLEVVLEEVLEEEVTEEVVLQEFRREEGLVEAVGLWEC
jgi:hypothetical protein